jgi:2-keto-3-deoxy-L-rhamnonate aldolase RhmA
LVVGDGHFDVCRHQLRSITTSNGYFATDHWYLDRDKYAACPHGQVAALLSGEKGTSNPRLFRKRAMTESVNAGVRLREKLRNGETTFGLWVTMESPTASEIAARMGLDWICIDTEHGELDLQEVANHLRAISRSSTAALVRIPGIEHGLIQRTLGLGAHGIIVPRIRTAEEIERAVCFAKYPPRGLRGMGVERATAWGKGRADANTANQRTIILPMIETVDSGKNLEAIMQVSDVDGFFFGPADYSASAGFVGEWEGPGVAEELIRIKDRLRARGFPCGIVGTDANDGKFRISQGFQMIGVGVDCTLLVKAIAEMMETLGRPVDLSVWSPNLS